MKMVLKSVHGFFKKKKSNAISELQGLTAVLVLLGDVFTMWINQCYELGPWGFGNVIGFRWHFASQSAKQPNVDTAEQFQLFPLTPSSLPGCTSLFLLSCLPFLLWLCKTNLRAQFLSLVCFGFASSQHALKMHYFRYGFLMPIFITLGLICFTDINSVEAYLDVDWRCSFQIIWEVWKYFSICCDKLISSLKKANKEMMITKGRDKLWGLCIEM